MRPTATRSLALLLFLALGIWPTHEVRAQSDPAVAQELAERLCAIAGAMEGQVENEASLGMMEATFASWLVAAADLQGFGATLQTAGLTAAQVQAIKDALTRVRDCNERIQKIIPAWRKRVADLLSDGTGTVVSPEQRRRQQRIQNEIELRELADGIETQLAKIFGAIIR